MHKKDQKDAGIIFHPLNEALLMSEKIPYTLEYTVRCSPHILFEFLATASGLQEWFADEVKVHEDTYSFAWNQSAENALVVETVPDELVRYRWEGAPESEYFEFHVKRSEVTGETVLLVTDFAERDEIGDQRRLWDSQLKELFHRIGA